MSLGGDVEKFEEDIYLLWKKVQLFTYVNFL